MPSVDPAPQLSARAQTCLPAEIEDLLIDVVADGFALYCCGARAAPNALLATYEWDQHVDLVTIRDFNRITTARLPKPAEDIFAPEVVVWAYEGPPQHALRALLALPQPTHPDAPTNVFPAPHTLHIPRAQQRPMTIRLPPPDRVRRRADRWSTSG